MGLKITFISFLYGLIVLYLPVTYGTFGFASCKFFFFGFGPCKIKILQKPPSNHMTQQNLLCGADMDFVF